MDTKKALADEELYNYGDINDDLLLVDDLEDTLDLTNKLENTMEVKVDNND